MLDGRRNKAEEESRMEEDRKVRERERERDRKETGKRGIEVYLNRYE